LNSLEHNDKGAIEKDILKNVAPLALFKKWPSVYVTLRLHYENAVIKVKHPFKKPVTVYFD